MFKAIVLGILFLTVIGAAGVAVYDSTKAGNTPAQNTLALDTPTTAEDYPAAAAPQPAAEENSQPPTPQQGVEVGQPWATSGVVSAVDETGLGLILDNTGGTIYVELGPAAYWQSQGITLEQGERLTVTGFARDGMYHAAVVTKADGSTLAVRDLLTGQPLWSGGAANSQGQGGRQDGMLPTEAQVSTEDWVTVTGTVTAVGRNSLTIQTAEGESLTMQLGRSGFAAEQGVVFAIGDEVSVLGFDQNGSFRAGEIDNLTQGGRLMLLDPNGRPLWAGPGSSGSGGQGGQGQGGSGQGNGYRGGRGAQ